MVRLIFPLLLILCLAGCQHGAQNNTEAVRQGVIDHLTKAKYNVPGMDITVSDATVSIAAKGQSVVPPMSLRYHLEHQNNQWVVVGPGKEATPHSGGMPAAAAPQGGNPHGDTMPPAGGAGKMPSPEDLPPAKK